MRYHNGVWLVLLAVLLGGCTVFEGSTKFTGDTTDYTGDTMDSITVSTSGETLLNGQPATDDWRIKVFVHEAFEGLQQDMARGNGEYLASLAQLVKVPEGGHQRFFEHAMRQYAVIARTGNVTPEHLRLSVLSQWAAN